MAWVFELITELCARPPGEWLEKLTPWIFAIIGGTIVLLMVYSCAAAG